MKRLIVLADKHWYVLSMLLIFSYTFLSGIQTICYSDEGYFGSAYQNFFDSHESTYTTDSYYLSILVGAIWDKIFGSFGIVSYTFLYGIVACATFHFIQRVILQEESRKWSVTAGYFVTLLYGFTYLINNNHLTCLLLSIEGCLLYEAYKEKFSVKYLLAAFLGVLGIFVRIPNVLLLLLLLIPILADRNNSKLVFSYLKHAMIGGLLAIAFVIFLMKILGHFEYFIKATFENLSIEASSGEESIHSFSSLMAHYMRDYVCVIGLMIIMSVATFVKRFFKGRFMSFIYMIMIFLFMIGIIKLLKIYVYVHSFNYIVFSVALFCLVRNIILKKYNNLVLYIISLGIAVLMPIGTDAGIASLGGLSSMFMLPLAFSEISREIDKYDKKERIINSYIFVSLIILYVLYRFSDMVAYGTWAEPGNRFEKVYTIDNSKYATVFVSKERDDEIDPALEVLNKYVKEGDYLFCFKDISIFNYLTRTKPYAYCSEPGFINPGLFKSHLDRAERDLGIIPIVIREIRINHNPGWERQNDIFEDFVKRHNYVMVWNNKKVEILVPQDKIIRNE